MEIYKRSGNLNIYFINNKLKLPYSKPTQVRK